MRMMSPMRLILVGSRSVVLVGWSCLFARSSSVVVAAAFVLPGDETVLMMLSVL